jgi:hypothetical protein
VDAQVDGGVTTSDGTVTDTVTVADDVEVNGDITVAPEHTGQIADVFVYASYLPLDGSLKAPLYFMLDENGGIRMWNRDPAGLVAFQKVKGKGKGLNKKNRLHVPMHKGRFAFTGILQVSFGYRLDDGGMVSNAQPVALTIEQAAPAVTTEIATSSSTDSAPAVSTEVATVATDTSATTTTETAPAATVDTAAPATSETSVTGTSATPSIAN